MLIVPVSRERCNCGRRPFVVHEMRFQNRSRPGTAAGEEERLAVRGKARRAVVCGAGNRAGRKKLGCGQHRGKYHVQHLDQSSEPLL